MAIFPCQTKTLCVDPSTPFQNFSAEAPDAHIFIGRSTGFGPLYPPLGSDFMAVGCVTFCESTVSQEEADLCAERQNVECLSFRWPTEHPGFDAFGNPVPIPEQRQVFLNRQQSSTVQCSDGNPFTFTVPAGRYSSFSQAQSDQAALSEAQRLAAINLLCLGPLSPALVCSGDAYAGSITATGNFLTGANACWTIFGPLPPGINSDLETAFGCKTGSTTLNFFGTPTAPGIYPFSIEVQDGSGNFMVKPVTLVVRGITNAASIPTGSVGVDYSFSIEQFGFTNPIYSIESGTLPNGLTLSPTGGTITGTPTVANTFPFIVGITEAGTGVVACLQDFSIVVANSTCVMNGTTVSTIPPSSGSTFVDWSTFASNAALIFGGGSGGLGDHTLDVLSPVTNGRISTINLGFDGPVPIQPLLGVYHPTTGKVYVITNLDSSFTFARFKVVNPLTQAVETTVDFVSGANPNQLSIDTVHKRVYINFSLGAGVGGSLNYIDVLSNTQGLIYNAGGVGQSGVAYVSSLDLIAANVNGGVIDLFDAATLSSISVGTIPIVSTDQLLYVPTSNTLYYDDNGSTTINAAPFSVVLNRLTSVNFNAPAVGFPVTVTFNSTAGFLNGRPITIAGKHFTIASINSPTQADVTNIDAVPGALVPAGSAVQTTGTGTPVTIATYVAIFAVDYLPRFQRLVVAYFDGVAGTNVDLIDPLTNLVTNTFTYPAFTLFWRGLGASDTCKIFFPHTSPEGYVVST